jgi:hypothetical protein
MMVVGRSAILLPLIIVQVGPVGYLWSDFSCSKFRKYCSDCSFYIVVYVRLHCIRLLELEVRWGMLGLFCATLYKKLNLVDFIVRQSNSAILLFSFNIA